MYFGGIWGGQLQRWASGSYVPKDVYPAKDQPALSAKVARLGDDMISLAESPRDVVLLDENGKPLLAGDNGRRFFEASWLHKYNGTYLLLVLDRRHATSSCTRPAVAIRPVHRAGQDPRAGARLDQPPLDRRVQGEVVPLFYHDAQKSGGQTHLRNIKVTELKHRPDGTIETIDAYIE